ncbi:MAG: hybrid sensor histidine kinase/response regulator [Verrucomicrobiota bacterium]
MKSRPPKHSLETQDKIAKLVQTLRETERQLQELTGGEVDAFAADGQPYLLREAQDKLRHSEAALRQLAETQGAILNALPAHIALVDSQGVIVSVNEAWRQFAQMNALQGSDFGVGQNYIALCQAVRGDCSDQAHEVAAGLRAILDGTVTEFALEYPCHSPEEKRWFRLMATPLNKGEPGGAVVMHVNVTERKLAEETLRESERRYRLLFESNPQPMWVYDLETLQFLAVNHAAIAHYGYSYDEFLRLTIADIRPAEDIPALRQTVASTIDGMSYSGIWRHRVKDGRIIIVEICSHPLRFAGRRAQMVVALDVTEREKAEAALAQSEREQRQLAQMLEAEKARLLAAQAVAKVGSWETDLASMDVIWSDQTHRIFETDPQQFNPTHAAFLSRVHPEDRAAVEAAFAQSLEETSPRVMEHRILFPEGRVKFVEERWQAFRDDTGRPVRALGTCQDITERKQIEEALRKNEMLLRFAGRAAQLGGWSIQLPERILTWSDECCAIHDFPAGYKPGFDEGISYFLPEHQAEVRRLVEACAREGTSYEFELPKLTAKGRRIWVHSIGEAVRDADGKIIGLRGAFQDITERKQAALELARLNRALRMLSACGEALTRVAEEKQLLTDICRLAVEIGGYRMAWVGYAMEDAACSIVPMAHAGEEQGYLGKINLSWSDAEMNGRGPGGRTVRSGQTVICQDIAEEPSAIYWREEAQSRGYRSIVCLPLRDENRTFGLLGLYSSEPNQAGADELKLLQELADDLAFGIGNLRVRAERRRIHDAMQKVAASVSTSFGSKFFEHLAGNMAEALGARAGFVARLLPGEPLAAQTIAAVVDGQALDNLEFGLTGTPCENLVDDLIGTAGADQFFPHIPSLAALESKAYVGRRLVNSAGQTVGLLLVLFREPLKVSDFVASTLQIFATRAAAELERQEADARIREQASLLDKAQDAILVRDLDHRILYWNKSAERLYGWTAAEALGRPVKELVYRDPSSFQAATAGVIAKGEWIGELDQVTKDGKMLKVEGRWTLVRDEHGQPKSVLSINTDITEKKKLEARFLRTQRMESIGTLASGIAHDLNNVLAPIMMSVELLREMVTSEQGRTLLATLQGSAQRGSDLVKQVLSFARGLEGNRVSVNAVHLLREIQKIIRDTFPKNITFDLQSARDVWTVTGDPTQLHQVFMNLCVNARDAMPNGGLLSVSMENIVLDEVYAGMNPDSKPGAYVLVQVVDTGTGIPPGMLDKIFEPFFTTKEFGKGTGLGLSTTLTIVKSHGGFIHLFSELGRGTRFKVYLPATASATTPNQAVAEQTRLPQGNGELILVVDDEESIRILAQRTLERFGYRVLLACHGAEAAAIYAHHRQEIAVVLTDMAMPVMDGPALIVALKAMNPRVRIVGSSGLTTQAGMSKSIAGVEHFIPKPYTAEAMLNVLKQVLAEPENPQVNNPSR